MRSLQQEHSITFHKYSSFFFEIVTDSVVRGKKKKKNPRLAKANNGNGKSYYETFLHYILSNTAKDQILSPLKISNENYPQTTFAQALTETASGVSVLLWNVRLFACKQLLCQKYNITIMS